MSWSLIIDADDFNNHFSHLQGILHDLLQGGFYNGIREIFLFNGSSIMSNANLYWLESSMKWPFLDIVSFRVKDILRLENWAEATLCKKISWKSLLFEALIASTHGQY